MSVHPGHPLDPPLLHDARNRRMQPVVRGVAWSVCVRARVCVCLLVTTVVSLTKLLNKSRYGLDEGPRNHVFDGHFIGHTD